MPLGHICPGIRNRPKLHYTALHKRDTTRGELHISGRPDHISLGVEVGVVTPEQL